jgi:hypothetical protein
MVWSVQTKQSALRSYIQLFTFLALIAMGLSAQSEVLQEGWYKVTVGGQHAGYIVQRYEFDAKTKQFKSAYFMKTSALGGDFSESLTATSTEALEPISFRHLFVSAKETKSTEGEFSKGVMTYKVTAGDKVTSSQKQLKKGTFLSTFTTFLVLQNKAGGLKIGNNYRYTAIAEEDAIAYAGEAYVAGTEDYQGQKVFRVLNTFKNSKFISLLSSQGVTLKVKSPADSLEMTLTNTRAEAVGNLPLSEKSIEAIFGTMPKDSYKPVATEIKEPQKPSSKTSESPTSTKVQSKTKALAPPATEDGTGVPKGLSVPPKKGE